MWLKNEVVSKMKDIILQPDEQALHVLRSELERRANYQWRCKNGSVVDVKDMTTSHLVHAINMLEEYLAQKEVVMENYVDALDYYD